MRSKETAQSCSFRVNGKQEAKGSQCKEFPMVLNAVECLEKITFSSHNHRIDQSVRESEFKVSESAVLRCSCSFRGNKEVVKRLLLCCSF